MQVCNTKLLQMLLYFYWAEVLSAYFIDLLDVQQLTLIEGTVQILAVDLSTCNSMMQWKAQQ